MYPLHPFETKIRKTLILRIIRKISGLPEKYLNALGRIRTYNQRIMSPLLCR